MIRNIQYSSNILRNSCQQFLRNYCAKLHIETCVNSVTLLGRVGTEPEDGSKVVSFKLATDYNVKDENGDWTQRTDWHNVVVFNPALKKSVVNHLKKGQRVMVNGRVTYREEDGDDGKSKTSTRIVANHVEFFK